jgi:hypothetical protein
VNLQELQHQVALRLLRWKLRVRNVEFSTPYDRRDFKWHKQALAVALLFASVPFLFHWGLWIPSPGKAVAAMGVVAAVMSLRGEMGGMEKVAWILLLFGFLAVEVKSIDNDRTLAEQERSATVERERQGFEKIAKGIETSIYNSDREFKQTMGRIDKNISTVTGGSTFCVVLASYVGTGFLMIANARGSDPLHEVSVDMVDLDVERTVKVFTYEAIQGFTTHLRIPFLAPEQMRAGQILTTIPLGNGNARNFHFNFYSMNGTWGESLSLRMVKGQWIEAIKVTKEWKPNQQKTLYTLIPDDYPRINGKVDW